MNRIFITALLCSAFFPPAFAAELDFDSKVNEATVYPRGAEVVRVATGNIAAGDHVVIVDDLPGKILSNSVRVEGSSAQDMAISSVDVRQLYVSNNDNAGARREIEQKIESLNDEIAALGQKIANAKTQKTMLQGLAGRAILPRKQDGTAVVISASELDELFSLTGSKLSELTDITANARIEIRKLTKQIAELQKKLAEASPKQQLKSVVAINLNAKADGVAEFRISYNVARAGWSPVYDARLTLGDKGNDSKIELVRRASVQQSTTDKWENIKLILSTARPRGSTQAPGLRPYELSEMQAFLERRKKRKNSGFAGILAPSAESEAKLDADAAPAPAKAMVREEVAIEFAGFLAEYKIPGKVSISNAGARKNVTIGTEEFAAEISAQVVPKLDPTAYLTAKFRLAGSAPYLPGAVSLSRDGVFLGRASLPLLNGGEEYSLGFGRDDFIKIKRNEVTNKKGESGFISTVNVEERKFTTEIENLHDFPMKVVIKDQLPYSRHEDIVVEMTGDTNRPDERNVDKKRGIVAWEKLLKAKAKTTINFGYKVSWPKEMRITPVR